MARPNRVLAEQAPFAEPEASSPVRTVLEESAGLDVLAAPGSAHSPARALQQKLVKAFVADAGVVESTEHSSDGRNWSPRRTLAFVALASSLLWAVIGLGVYAALQ